MIDLTTRNATVNIESIGKNICSLYDSYKPDPAWNYQDRAGHIHRWDLAAKKVHSIKRVIDQVIPHCCDGNYWEEEISHLECRECGEVIEPGYLIDVPAGFPVSIPTSRSVEGSFELLPGEEHILESDMVTLSRQGVRYQAYIIGYDALLPVSDPLRQTGITVHFGHGEVIA